jgi:ubiquinone/menaquinone biosynthesis C-methylase UbiE
MHNPERILAEYVKPEMTVLDIGPGMGFWTLPMARLVGPRGKVIAVDVQEKMLAGLMRRAQKAGISDHIETRLCQAERLNLQGLAGSVDFALAFAVVHEVPDACSLLSEIHTALRPGRRLLISEPTGHVTDLAFAETLAAAEKAGFVLVARPDIARSRSAVLEKRK